MPFREFYPNWKHAKPLAYSVTVWMLEPFQPEQVYNTLNRLSVEIPYFEKTSKNEKNNSISLQNSKADIDKQVAITFLNAKDVGLSWGINAHEAESFDIDAEVKKILSIVGSVRSDMILVDTIDFRFLVSFECTENFGKVIHEAFYKNSPIGNVFQNDMIVDNGLIIRGLIDESHASIIRVNGETTNVEAGRKKYKKDTYNQSFGVARIGGFKNFDSLVDAYLENRKLGESFGRDIFIPQVVEPLDKAFDKVFGGAKK